MNSLQPANNRAHIPDEPTHCDEDEIGALLRHALMEDIPEAVTTERWNCLAERIVADLQDQLEKNRMELHCSDVRRVGFMLRPWSSVTTQLA